MISGKNSTVKPLDAARTARHLAKFTRLRPALAIVLGSGFGHAVKRLNVEAEISYARLPGFPKPGVGGHAGRILLGNYGGGPVCVLSGRAHYYEGHSMDEVAFPVRVLAEFGVTLLTVGGGSGPAA